MQKPVVVVTNRVFPETEALLAAHARVIVNRADEPWSRDEVQARCREADAMLAFMTDQVDAAFLTGCPRLKVVGARAQGLRQHRRRRGGTGGRLGDDRSRSADRPDGGAGDRPDVVAGPPHRGRRPQHP